MQAENGRMGAGTGKPLCRCSKNGRRIHRYRHIGVLRTCDRLSRLPNAWRRSRLLASKLHGGNLDIIPRINLGLLRAIKGQDKG